MSRDGALLIILGGGVVVGLTALYWIDPSIHSLFPPCVFHALTGLLCPGCGLTRAVHESLHGNVHAAISFNPFLPVYTALLGILTIGTFCRATIGRTPALVRLTSPTLLTAALGIVTFGIVRNL